MSLRACSSKGRTGIPGRNISSWGRKYDLKICPEAETIRPKMTIRPLDEQALCVQLKRAGKFDNNHKEISWRQKSTN